MSERLHLSFELNGQPVDVWTHPNQSLLELLRETVGATEVKHGCGEGVCGTCTVLLDSEAVNACLVFAPQVAGCRITTVKGLGNGKELHPLQAAFLRHGGSQCGFCTPGMILAAYEFTETHPGAGREEIRGALVGNLCRCTGYTKILDSIEAYLSGSDRETPPHDRAVNA